MAPEAEHSLGNEAGAPEAVDRPLEDRSVAKGILAPRPASDDLDRET
jgi:hypothetical protein